MRRYQQEKGFAAPVWILAGIACIRVVFSISTLMAMRELQTRHGTGPNSVNLGIGWLLVAVPALEALTYLIIRKRKLIRSWVWIHLICMVLCMVIVPVVFILFTRLSPVWTNRDQYFHIIRLVSQLRFYLFWALFTAGTAFFIALLIRTSRSEKDPAEVLIDAIGSGH